MSVEEFGYKTKAPLLTLISCGDADSAVGTFPKEYHELFEKNGNKNIYFEVPGANHDNVAVAAGLYNFVQAAFGALNPEPACTEVEVINPNLKFVTKTKVVTKTDKITKTVKVTKTAKVTKTKTAVKTHTVKKTKKVVKTVTKN